MPHDLARVLDLKILNHKYLQNRLWDQFFFSCRVTCGLGSRICWSKL